MKKLQQVLLSRVICAIFISVSAALPSNAQEDSSRRVAELMQYGNLAARKGAWTEATHRWKQVIRIDSRYSPAHNNLAIYFERIGDYREAQNEYQLALEGHGGDQSKIRENFQRFSDFYERILRSNRQAQGQGTAQVKKKKP